MNSPLPPLVAAVDLGSNSFHMVVGRVEGGDFQVMDRLKEPVRLGAGLVRGELRPETSRAALACLERFGQRLRDMPRDSVRAVGTNTLRKTQNPGAFLDAASVALGHPIEVISGREEARLIYLGVYHDLHSPGRRLVVDIGGGSTEVIAGDGPEPAVLDSLGMGCVSWSLRFFPEEEIRKDGMRQAITAARLKLETAERRQRKHGWEMALGSSGTINAVERVLIENAISPEGITPKGCKKLADLLVDVGRVSRLKLAGLPADRRAVLPGGLAILIAVLEALRIEHMTAAQGALREGVLVDLLGRFRHEDVRGEAVDRLAARCRVDGPQAHRVEATALALYDQVARSWDLEDGRDLLAWGARLHEIGIFVSWQGYQRHGAYIITNADLAGFSRPEQAALATLIALHRGKLGEARQVELKPEARLLRLAALLRLAVRLHRSRSPRPMPALDLNANATALNLNFPVGWLDEHPLTVADLVEVDQALVECGLRLHFR